MLTALNNEEGSGLRLGLFFLEWAGENSRCRMVTSKEAFSARPAASRPGPARPAPPRARAEDGSLHHPPRQSAGGPGLRAQLQHRRRSGRDSRVQGGWKERQTEASTGEARPDGQHPDSKKLSPCNSEAHRSGLPRCHWFPRTRPGSGQRRDRPRQLPPEPRGPSPPLGPRRGADQAARSGPLLRGRTGEGRHLRPVLRRSARAPSLRPDTLRAGRGRFRPPAPARVCCFPVRAGTQPRQNGSGHRKTRPWSSQHRPSSAAPWLFLRSQDPSSLEKLRVTFYVKYAVSSGPLSHV